MTIQENLLNTKVTKDHKGKTFFFSFTVVHFVSFVFNFFSLILFFNKKAPEVSRLRKPGWDQVRPSVRSSGGRGSSSGSGENSIWSTHADALKSGIISFFRRDGGGEWRGMKNDE
jgi:hypothetical protein